MANITFTPVIYKSYRRKDGTYNVKIRMTLNRKSRQITTSINAAPEQLTRSLKIRDRELQRRVDSLLDSMRMKVSGIDPMVVRSLTPDDVLRLLGDGEDKFSLDFFDFAKEVIEQIDKRPGRSASNYRSAVKALGDFCGASALDINEMSSSFLRSFETYLRSRHGDKARAVSLYTSAVAYIFRQARLRYNDEESGNVKIRNPYEYYKPPKQVQSRHRAIGVESLQMMIDHLPGITSEMESRVMSLFLLSFGLMGMNLPDLYECDKADKAGIVTYRRSKTRGRRADEALMKVKVDDRIRPLVRRLEGRQKFLDLSERNTFYSVECQLSRYFDRAVMACGVEEHVTFYSARHTWATVAYRIGIEKGIINDCLCHVDQAMKVTDIYIEKDWERLWAANSKVLDCLDWTPLSKLICPGSEGVEE